MAEPLASPAASRSPDLAAGPARYRLTISYLGSRYAGWQRQANALAIQQVVEEALSDLTQERSVVVGASRTDAGVHARRQVVHLDLQRAFAPRGLIFGSNVRLPEDIRVLAAEQIAPAFHARRSARAKVYRYRLVRTRVLSPLDAAQAMRVEPRLDLAPIVDATRLLLGRHDFSAFAVAGGSHEDPQRSIFSAVWHEDGPCCELVIEGSGFLRGMVRTLVGTLLEVGRGRRSVSSFGELLAGGPRSLAGPTAPPQGLVLERVVYPPPWDDGPEGAATADDPG